MLSKGRQKARRKPNRPMPKEGKTAARNALPQPPKTSQNEPKVSANNLLLIGTILSSCCAAPPSCRVSWRGGSASDAGKGDAEEERARERSAFTGARSEEHKSELKSLMRITYADFCLKKKKK